MNKITNLLHHNDDAYELRSSPVPPLVLNSMIPLRSVEEGWQMLTHESIDNIAYQRYENPTTLTLKKNLKVLSGAKYSLAVNSGMTAAYTVLRALLRSGNHVVAEHSMYHEITDQLSDDSDIGISYDLFYGTTLHEFQELINENTVMFIFETPTNPTMRDYDLQPIIDYCKTKKIMVVCDNSMLTPVYFKSLDLNADIEFYSLTKHLNGHGDALGGAICTNSEKLHDKLQNLVYNSGLTIDPFSAWLIIRGMKTCYIRMQAQSENAMYIIDKLNEEYPQLEIKYPGFSESYESNGYLSGGSIFSIILPTKEMGTAFIDNTSLIKLGTTFGNIESLCYHFSTFTRQTRDTDKIGLPKGLVRLSIGLENKEDIASEIISILKKIGYNDR